MSLFTKKSSVASFKICSVQRGAHQCQHRRRGPAQKRTVGATARYNLQSTNLALDVLRVQEVDQNLQAIACSSAEVDGTVGKEGYGRGGKTEARTVPQGVLAHFGGGVHVTQQAEADHGGSLVPAAKVLH
jgi:hypothetical protein